MLWLCIKPKIYYVLIQLSSFGILYIVNYANKWMEKF